MTDYFCSECHAVVTSEGSEAADHMQQVHGVDPEDRPQDAPYLIPVDSNPTDIPNAQLRGAGMIGEPGDESDVLQDDGEYVEPNPEVNGGEDKS